jgi:hypothetical protein
MIYLSNVSSFWLILNSSYDHEFHLFQQFIKPPHDNEHLLVEASLAQPIQNRVLPQRKYSGKTWQNPLLVGCRFVFRRLLLSLHANMQPLMLLLLTAFTINC